MDEFSRQLFTDNYLTSLTLAQRHRACDIARRDYDLMIEVLVGVVKEATDTAFRRDTWQPVTAFEKPTYSACVFRRTVKSQMEIELAIETDAVRLRYGLSFVHELPRMTDRFWAELIDLVHCCAPKYEMSEWPLGFASTPWNKYISQRRKSIVFSMISDFILTTQADRDSHPSGDFEFEFPLEPWKTLIPKLRDRIRRGVALSYMLYRSRERWRQQVVSRAKRRRQR